MKTKLVPFDIEKAKQGAKVVTRYRLPAKILDYPVKNEDCPILGLVLIDGKEFPLIFTNTGSHYKNSESCYDLFIEEEVEEDDSDYDPYKATVESIADMVERYSELQSLEELKDFYNNVKIKCRDAFEYGRVCMINQDEEPDDIFEIKPDKWYVCHLTACFSEQEIGGKTWFYKGTSYLGTEILKLNLDFASENYSDYFRPWNIQDAKNGDVLVCDTCIVLFKEIDGLNIKCHCTYHFMDTPMFFVDTLQNKSVFCPATKERRDFLFQKMKEAGYEWDEKKKELKKIENEENEEKKELKKVEPKFEVGDWVVQDNVGIYKVTEIWNWYEVIDSDGSNYSISFDQESMCHLWTIQDAKPGDVLHAVGQHNDCIFISNRLDNDASDGDKVFATGYCCLDITADKMEFCVQGPDSIEVNAIKPATKKQCDLLFQKMKEAGYEWDFERKELKKIKYKNDMAEKEVKQKSSFNEFGFRRMTNQELSWWLRDHPEEHRECRFETASFECEIFTDYPYLDSAKDCEVPDKYYIRKNGREWQEPLVEI